MVSELECSCKGGYPQYCLAHRCNASVHWRGVNEWTSLVPDKRYVKTTDLIKMDLADYMLDACGDEEIERDMKELIRLLDKYMEDRYITFTRIDMSTEERYHELQVMSMCTPCLAMSDMDRKARTIYIEDYKKIENALQ